MKLILGLLLLFSVNVAQAESGSTSGSCSDSHPELGYFYTYTYQYVYIYNGNIESESHSFSFSGFLDDADDSARIVGHNSRHVIYRSAKFDMAVPWKSGEGFWVKRRGVVEGPGQDEDGRGWIKLCSY